VIVLVAVYRRAIALDLWLALTVSLAIFVAPNLHFHDLALLLLPMTVIARQMRGQLAPFVFLPLSPILILGVGLTIAGYSMQALAVLLAFYTERRITGRTIR